MSASSPQTGLLFDIQRFSLHDGPGIRTTVFFKGCPLRCRWCHNPESRSARPELAYLANLCGACGACMAACPQGAHKLVEGTHQFDRALCTLCGRCAEACVFGALRVTGRPYTVEEVLAVVRRDATYYQTSGGGMTVSGGEPLSQPAFLRALLEVARAEGIHICVETSGQTPRETLLSVQPLVDVFLFDYKATDPTRHRALTGVSNELILANLDELYQVGAHIILRCPLAPGVNDTPDHLAGIAALDRRYPRLEGVELMAYHNVGNPKYVRYGYENPLPDLPTMDEAAKACLRDAIRAAGGTRADFSS